jgi:hypothetical protein
VRGLLVEGDSFAGFRGFSLFLVDIDDDDDVMYYYKAQLAVTNMAPVTPHILFWKDRRTC